MFCASCILVLTNAGRCATIKVSKDRIYHSLSAVFGHKSQISWVSWLPADEIDVSALLFFSRAFLFCFLLLTNASRCVTIKVSKDQIYHSLSAVFGHKSQISWASWLPADEIDVSALLFFSRAFLFCILLLTNACGYGMI